MDSFQSLFIVMIKRRILEILEKPRMDWQSSHDPTILILSFKAARITTEDWDKQNGQFWTKCKLEKIEMYDTLPKRIAPK